MVCCLWSQPPRGTDASSAPQGAQGEQCPWQQSSWKPESNAMFAAFFLFPTCKLEAQKRVLRQDKCSKGCAKMHDSQHISTWAESKLPSSKVVRYRSISLAKNKVLKVNKGACPCASVGWDPASLNTQKQTHTRAHIHIIVLASNIWFLNSFLVPPSPFLSFPSCTPSGLRARH